MLNSIYKSHLDTLSKILSKAQTKFLCVTLIITPSLHLQMLLHLELMDVWSRENGGLVFLWLVSNIKSLVTTSYVMGKYQTGVFMSVFWEVGESME